MKQTPYGNPLHETCWTNLVVLQSWTKVLTQLSKTNAFYRHPSVIEKTSFLSIAKAPSPPPLFNIEIRSVVTVVWLQHWKGERESNCENWRLKNSCVQQNRFFSWSDKTAFVHDCSWLFCSTSRSKKLGHATLRKTSYHSNEMYSEKVLILGSFLVWNPLKFTMNLQIT